MEATQGSEADAAISPQAAAEPTDLAAEAEERVIALALDGRREAWAVLVARHQHRVLLSLLARGVRLDRAQDIVQETWARLIAQQRAGALARLELPGLAITQAGFLAVDDARRRASTSIRLDDTDAVESGVLADPGSGIERRLATRQQLDRARAELARCPPKARAVFELVYDEPTMPHVDAARILGLSVQRVRQSLCEVRARLRAVLESSDE